MPTRRLICRYCSTILVLLTVAMAGSLPGSAKASERLAVNAEVVLNGHAATVTKLDNLPFVENEYSKRFKFDSAENPKLKELRERFKLDEVVASGRDEFARQVLLLD